MEDIGNKKCIHTCLRVSWLQLIILEQGKLSIVRVRDCLRRSGGSGAESFWEMNLTMDSNQEKNEAGDCAELTAIETFLE